MFLQNFQKVTPSKSDNSGIQDDFSGQDDLDDSQMEFENMEDQGQDQLEHLDQDGNSLSDKGDESHDQSDQNHMLLAMEVEEEAA